MTASQIAYGSRGDRESVGGCGLRRREHDKGLTDESAAGVSPDDGTPMVERVARVVAGIGLIGEARNALNAAGWHARISANRITVDEGVEAEFIPRTNGSFGLVDARWVISAIARAEPVWIVGGERRDPGRSGRPVLRH